VSVVAKDYNESSKVYWLSLTLLINEHNLQGRTIILPVNFVKTLENITVFFTMAAAIPPPPAPFDVDDISHAYVVFIGVTVMLTVLSTPALFCDIFLED